jgi:MFS family permease
MSIAAGQNAQLETPTPASSKRALGVASGVHALQDGYTDLVYVMLPIWQAEFGLAYSAIGILRGLFVGAMAGFQIPATMLARKVNASVVLAGGAALTGLSYMLAGFSGSLAVLAVALAIGGLGAATQHPLASSLVAGAYPGKAALRALGTYNFAGDIGKMTLPALVSVMLLAMPWRGTLTTVGLLGIAAGALILVLARRAPFGAAVEKKAAVPPVAAATSGRGFPLLLSIGVIDSATRMAFLTFLPFLLTSKGASLPTIGFALTLVFAGGAAGKLVCAFIGARIGVIATVFLTEGLTAIAIIALLPLSLEPGLLLLPVIGVALNGTSSVLYGSVPLFVTEESRSRAFGIFYTGTIGSGALSPVLYGFVGDALGIPITLAIVTGVVLLTLPLALAIRPQLMAAQMH